MLLVAHSALVNLKQCPKASKSFKSVRTIDNLQLILYASTEFFLEIICSIQQTCQMQLSAKRFLFEEDE